MIVVGYIRVSSKEQAEGGVSLDAQRAKITAYCALHDHTLLSVEEDAGISGGTMDRPGLQAALAMLKRGTVKGLVVVALSRLSRSVADLSSIVDTQFRSGKRALFSVTESIDTSSAMGRGIINIFGSLNSLERDQGGERTATALQHLKASGKRYSRILPFGKRLADDGETLVLDEREAEVAAAARELRGHALSFRAVAETLASRNMLSRTGKPFTAQAVSAMVAA